MELRHFRYFVAVAEAGSLTVAAAQKLHTSQPSLSRQIRDLESELGSQLLTRRARGIELTPAGRAFLDHARLVLSSQYSPLLADGLSKGKIDAAFLRRETGLPDLAFRLLVKEPLMVVLPSDHRLAALKAISPRDLVGETFVAVSSTAPVLRAIVDKYLKRSGVDITPDHEADHLSMGMSLIATTGGVGLLPAYAQNFLPSSVTSRPLKGDAPTVDLVLGYRKSNQSPILKLLLSRLDELVARASKKIG